MNRGITMREVFLLGIFILAVFCVTPIAHAQEALSEREKERVRNLAANITNRMEATVTRLQNITDRLQSRAEKMTGHAAVTADAQNQLIHVETILQNASKRLATIDTDIEEVITSENPANRWRNVRINYLETKDLLRQSHQKMVAVLLQLKNPLAWGVEETIASSTPETTATTTASTTETVVATTTQTITEETSTTTEGEQ